MQPVVMLVIAGVAMFSVIGGVSLLSHYYTCRLHRDWYSAAWSGQENYTHWWIPGMCIA